MRIDEAEHAHGGLLSTLRNGGLRRLFGAEVVSGAGEGIFWVALVVFLADQPRFGLWLTLAVIVRLAPRAFLSLPAGSLVDWFGEIGLLEQRPRTATVTTACPTTVWRIPGDVFLDDAGAAPSALVDAMADRLASHRPAG